MSLVISVYVGEGIVLAGDSRSSFNAAYKTIGKDGHPEKEVANRSYGCIFLMIIVAIMAYFLA